MKRYSSWIVIGVLALLTGASVYFYFFKSKYSSVEQSDRDFAFKDTAAITKIFIADKDGRKSLLVRKDDGWYVNEKYKCRGDAVLNLLEVIKRVEVKMPVPKSGLDNVLKFMSYNAVKVEVYVGDEKVKQYYVGHETEDGEGSFMILTDLSSGENYANPYVCFIPGFKGYLAPRYIAEENDWRDRMLMNYIPPDIKSIRVEVPGAPADSSFSIDLQNANTFILRNIKGQIVPFDESKLRQYLIYYQNLSYETLVTGKNKRLTDSLSMNTPFQIVSVTKNNNETDRFVCYRKQFNQTFAKDASAKFDFDPDRFYINFDKGRQWALTQYYVFGKLFVNAAYFAPEQSVKK